MVNAGVIVLIIIAIILGIGAIIMISLAIISDRTKKSHNGGSSATEPCSQFIDIDTLPQIPDDDICIQQGQKTSKYYIGNLNNQSLDFVVAPWATSNFDVCVGYCSKFIPGTGTTGGTCSGPGYNGLSAQQNFDNCMQQLSTNECFPPKPIAARGTILYYAFSPTCNICDNCGKEFPKISEKSNVGTSLISLPKGTTLAWHIKHS